MVIDDEPDVLSTLKAILEQCPFSPVVEGHIHPKEALDAFRENPNGNSIILTDVRMPEMNGFQLAIQLKNIGNDVPILFMSAIDGDEQLPGYPLELKKECIVQKPKDILRLCEIVQLTIQRS